MSDAKPISLRGREITPEVLHFIQETIAAHADEGRSAISRILCTQWNWRQSNGGLKDMACRDLLLRLERLGLIHLPARQKLKANYKIIPPVPAAFEEQAVLPLTGRVDGFGYGVLALIGSTDPSGSSSWVAQGMGFGAFGLLLLAGGGVMVWLAMRGQKTEVVQQVTMQVDLPGDTKVVTDEVQILRRVTFHR